jgi:2-polyprenyl-6-methoxyphenol hydroxylase-like FAD-dependent oxidoreductase
MRTEADPALRRDVTAQQRLIRAMLAEAGWETPAVLDAMTTSPDFYFDMLARVDMPSLSTGRVTLLGDSGFCGSPMTGMGTAMAIVGAYVLAGEIAAAPADLATALTRYEEIVRPFLDKAKELPGGGIKMMLPTSRVGTRMARVSIQVMTSRVMRPLMLRMMSNTDDYVLPTY